MPDGPPTLSAKPANPTHLKPQTWLYAWRRTLQEFVRDGCVDAAGALTFFAVLSVFPAGLAFIASIGVIADGEAVLDRLLSLLGEVAPAEVVETLRTPLTEVAESSAAGFTLIVAIATAVWSASIYVGAFGRALNRIYGVEEGRPYWKRKLSQLAVTVVLLFLLAIMAGVVVLSGPIARVVGDALDIGDTSLAAWDILKWPLLAAAIVTTITLLYKGTSNLTQPPLRWLTLGAGLAVLTLAIASAGFVLYVSNFADYNRTFGALAGVVIFLLWLFLINLALLLGAEFNAEVERGRQLQAGQQAESRLQLPVRDTAVSERRTRSRKLTEQRGTRLRQGQALPPRRDSLFAWALRLVRGTWRRLTRRAD
ncbi:YihY/virulence factor BrkB family protein [Microbacterium sp. NPDC087665]|uniref:YihY/virulence factor BrkB family protein n=1 Tax=Microbacterium sp. NPDC087665 TaxID=3364194 RepID=UPI0037FB2DF4